MTYKYRVSEIFGPTIQGEGAQIGRPTVFVRLGGCDYRCSWCDSLYAVLPEHRKDWAQMDAGEIIAEVNRLATRTVDDNPDHDELPAVLITLSGGNPALWNAEHLIDEAKVYDHTVTMETQGSLYRPWFEKLDHLCISPKPPSSGMDTVWSILRECVNGGPKDTILKVVVFNDEDFAFAGKVRQAFPKVPLYLQVGNTDVRPEVDDSAGGYRDHVTTMLYSLEQLAQRVIKAGWHDVRVLPQLHALMWGNKRAV